MPEEAQKRQVQHQMRRRVRAVFLPFAGGIGLLVASPMVFAQSDGFDLRLSGLMSGRGEGGLMALALGLALVAIIVYAAVISGLHIRYRRLWREQMQEQARNLRMAQTSVERANLFLAADRQILIIWNLAHGTPELEGDPGLLVESHSPSRILTYSEWLKDEDARTLDRATHQLRADGTAFSQTLKTKRGEIVEVEGRPVAGSAVLAIRIATGERLHAARLADEKAALEAAHRQLTSILEAIPQPIWLRDSKGNLGWVNRAYAHAVDAQDTQLVLSQQSEFLDSQDRALIRQAQAQSGRYHGAVTAIVAGQRRRVDVVEVAGPQGGGGFALDISELEAARQAMERQMEAHLRTLDELPTAIVSFDRKQQMIYSNRAFRALFALDGAFLTSSPTNSALLDRLRANGRLPETGDYREWKADLLSLYMTTETAERGWHLPDGRALRVLITPNPEGGITYHFDDETERLNLATSYDQLKNTQWETLMALSEGVGVFGSDGRLQLSNPAFARLWGIDPSVLDGTPHINMIGEACRVCLGSYWGDVARIVCALGEGREDHHFQAITTDGRVFTIATTPLPDGATLVTVTDVTDSVEAERRLREHNEALRQAAQLRTNFIKSVSFELRTPLSNIVGRAEALAEGVAGALNSAQASYAQDLVRASGAMLVLTQDILEIVDAENGAIDLKPEVVALDKMIAEVTERLKDRMSETGVRISINFTGGNRHIRADRKRLWQILFNLLADSISASQSGDVVRLAARRDAEGVTFQIMDTEKGMLVGLESRSGSHPRADTRDVRAAGVRFSLAKALIALMGGELCVQDAPQGGYCVECLIPDEPVV